MFRTRDFIVIFSLVVFLVALILVTVWQQRSGSESSLETVKYAQVDDKEFSAEVYVPESVSREERLAEMRRKIAEGGEESVSFTASSEEEELTEEEGETGEESVQVALQQCSGYVEYAGNWPRHGVKLDVTEGVRVFYLEVVSEYELDPLTATSGTTLPPDISRDVLLQLPISPISSYKVSCLTNDVIGVAQDGSLIRNNEVGLYGIFGAGTVVGYALDGFPIYGVADVLSDECGGSMVNGQYGYYLSSEREVILNCFIAVPASI